MLRIVHSRQIARDYRNRRLIDRVRVHYGSVKLMRCCPAAAAILCTTGSHTVRANGHGTDTNFPQYLRMYHRDPRSSGQKTLSCGPGRTINTMQSASEAGIQCRCVENVLKERGRSGASRFELNTARSCESRHSSLQLHVFDLSAICC